MKAKEITDQDFITLRDMIAFELRRVEDNDRRENLHYLETLIEQGQVISSRDVPGEIVTMGAWVRLLDLDSQKQFSCTLVYPEQADLEQQRLSVLAPLGTAILGRRVSDTVDWNVPEGVRHLRIEAVRHYAKPNKG